MKSSVRLIRQCVLAAALIFGICTAGRAQFTNVAYDGFNYSPNGATLSGQNGGTGWTGPWTNTYTSGASFLVSTTGMSHPGLTNSGGSMVWGSGGNGISEDFRALPRQSNGVVYVQFLGQFGSSSGGGTPNLRLLDSGALTGGFGGNGGTYGAFVSILNNSLNAAADGSSSSTASLSSINLVVARIDYQSNKTSMWVNPDLSTFNYQNPGTTPDATYPGLAPTFNGIDLVSRSPANVDEITILSEPGQTPPPLLGAPVSGATYNSSGISISYILPTAPLAGTVRLTFTNNLQTLTLVLTNGTNVSFVLLPHNPLASPDVVSAIPVSGTLPDGVYNVQLSYQDTNGDPAASAAVTNITVDTVTLSPVLLAPANSAAVNYANLHVSYQLPEAPTPGSVTITFYNSSTNITLQLDNSQTNDFTVPPGLLTNAAAVTSATAPVLPDGIYNVLLGYQDASGNPAAFAGVTNVTVDTVTQPPVLLAPATSSVVNSTGLHLSYQLPEAPASGSVAILFFNSSTNITLGLNNSQTNDFVVSPASLLSAAAITSASSTALPDGRYTVVLSYQDALLNPAATVAVTNVLAVLQPLQFYPTSITFSNGLFQLGFSNNLPDGLGFTYDLMTSSNVTTPLSNWVDLGPVTESPPGQFQIQDLRSNTPVEFYLLRLH